MKQSFKTYFKSVKNYIFTHKDQSIGVAVTLGLVLAIGVILFVSFASGPRFVYQPVKSCELFTPTEAQSLLGENIVAVDSKDPEIQGDVAVSKCSYTNMNPDEDQMVVAAVAIRSAVNDDGALKNRDDFATSQANNDTDTITGIGEKAYFNKTSGQLHVFSSRNWIIINMGIGTNPASNSPEKAVELAKLVLD